MPQKVLAPIEYQTFSPFINMEFSLLRYLLNSSEIMLRLQLSCIVLSLCFLVFLFFQKISPKHLFGDDGPYAGYIFNAMGVVFSLIFAFITVLVWQNYNNVSDSVNKEAGHLNNIYRLYSAFPPEIEKSGQESLRSYTKIVIEDEWPLMKKDQFSPEAFKKLLVMEDQIIKYQPQSSGQSNAHQQMLRLITEYTELRRSRIYNAQFALGRPAMIGLISSSFIFLFFSWLFKMGSVRTHLIMLAFLGFIIVGVVYFLLIYIHPFLGPMAIGPEPFQRLLDFSWSFK
jgi:hypothetical protein